MIILFFLGICTGFYNVYRMTQNLGTGIGVKRDNTPLPKDKKQAKYSGEFENNQTKNE